MLMIQDLHFEYENISLLSGLNLTVEKGEIVTLIGSSGCGKSTLLRLINGLETFSSGRILVDKSEIAYMMQEDLLLPWRTAFQNAALPLELQRQNTNGVIPLLHKMGLKGFEHTYPHELSGGMRQRVAMVRSLAQKKPLLLLDEPFSSLDVALREQLYRMLRSIRNEMGTTIMLVTHDFHDAVSLSDRILHLEGGNIKNMWSVTDTIRQKPELYGKMIGQMRSALMANV